MLQNSKEHQKFFRFPDPRLFAILKSCSNMPADPQKPKQKVDRFRSGNFTTFWTLFSEYFATFPRGTCSLSGKSQYSVLDEFYHPIQAALSSSPTLWKQRHAPGPTSLINLKGLKDFHPLWSCFPAVFSLKPKQSAAQKATTPRMTKNNWHSWIGTWTWSSSPFSLAATKGIPFGFFSSA